MICDGFYSTVHNVTKFPVTVYADYIKLDVIFPHEIVRFDDIDLSDRCIFVKVGSEQKIMSPQDIIEISIFCKCAYRVKEEDLHLHARQWSM